MTGVLVVAGRCLLGLGVVAAALGWAAWTWCTGGRWYPERPHRRRVSRPVRATGQNLLLVLAVGMVLAPAVTAVTVGAAAVVLAVAVVVVRIRRREANRVRVQVGPVTGHRRVRPACHPPVAFDRVVPRELTGPASRVTTLNLGRTT